MSVTSPADGATVPYGTAVSFNGSADVGASTATPNTALIYDLDVSGSTQTVLPSPATTNCDNPNGDGASGTTLDCEITSLANLNASAITKGSIKDVGAVALGGGTSGTGVGDSVAGDVGPGTGTQLLTAPDADGDTNGRPDVVDVLRSAHVPPYPNTAPGFTLFTPVSATNANTNYEDSVIVATNTASTSTAATKIVVLVSDGSATFGNFGLPGASGNGFFSTALAFRNWVHTVAGSVKFVTFAVGSAASCTPTWNGLGTLNDIALATGGSCTLVLDPANLPNVLPDLVGSLLTSVTGEIDSVATPLTVSPAPPVSGPAAVTWATTAPVGTLAPGTHTFCATVHGSDSGGTGSAKECSTITVVAADPGGPYGGDPSSSFEGSTIPIAATAYGGATFDHWSYTAGAGVDAGAGCTFADPNAASTTVTCTDDGTFTLTANTTSPTDARSTDLVLFNRDPVLQAPAFSPSGTVLPGTSVTVSGTFADDGTNDTHTCQVTWSDGPVDTGVVTETDGAGTCSDTRTLSTVGGYTASMTVTDDNSGTDTQSTATGVTVSNASIDPGSGSGGAYVTTEGSAVSPTAVFPSGATLSWSAIVATAHGTAACGGTGLTTASPSISCNDDGTGTIALAVTTGGTTQNLSAPLVVGNANPVVATPTLSATLVPVGTNVTASATFTDAGANDAHTCTVRWDDGLTPVAGTVSETAGSGSCSQTSAFTVPGIYRVLVTVTDDDGGVGSASYEYLVVYDPSAGFVTGGGWLNVAAGSYVADPTLYGKATFGFESRYKKGATTPSGNTEFQFHAASLNFSSTDLQWLVVSGAKAQYKGNGTINGVSGFGFLVTATDGQISGGGGTDKFRIKIWNVSTGATVFDNVLGASTDLDGASPQAIAGGSIVIHSS